MIEKTLMSQNLVIAQAVDFHRPMVVRRLEFYSGAGITLTLDGLKDFYFATAVGGQQVLELLVRGVTRIEEASLFAPVSGRELAVIVYYEYEY